MRRITLFATLALVLSAFGAYALRAQESVADRIAALPAVKDVQELESPSTMRISQKAPSLSESWWASCIRTVRPSW